MLLALWPLFIAVQTPLPPPDGGISKFIPIQVGEVKTKPKYLDLKYGSVVASGQVGLPKRFGAEIQALPTPRIERSLGTATATGSASYEVKPVKLLADGAETTQIAGGVVHASPMSIERSYGASDAFAGAWVRIASAGQTATQGSASAAGIQNLSDEEMVLMYLQLRKRRALRLHT